MWARRSAWERVTEREEFVGRFSFGSRFPQYLFKLVSWVCSKVGCVGVRVGVGLGVGVAYFMTAMLTGAVVLARCICVLALFEAAMICV